MNTKLLMTLAASSLVMACATSSIDYRPPEARSVENEIVVNKEFEEVWAALTRNLATDFFVINNLEKESNLINVSFSADDPSRFVTCGRSVREFSNARGDRRYSYDPAEDIEFTMTDESGSVYHVFRTNDLDGRANIYVAPEGEGQTFVSVTARYVINVQQETVSVGTNRRNRSSRTYTFSTNDPMPVTGDGVGCTARGNVERRILRYVDRD